MLVDHTAIAIAAANATDEDFSLLKSCNNGKQYYTQIIPRIPLKNNCGSI